MLHRCLYTEALILEHSQPTNVRDLLGNSDMNCPYNEMWKFAGAIYWTDIAAHFVIGFVIVNGGEKMPILDAGCVAWQYIRHGTFLWDVASAAPILVEVLILAHSLRCCGCGSPCCKAHEHSAA